MLVQQKDKAPTKSDEQGLKGTNPQNHNTTPASSKAGTRTSKQVMTRPTGSPTPRSEAPCAIQSSSSAGGTASSLEDIEKKFQEMEKKIQMLKRMEAMKAELEELEQRVL